jgi:co-chaperonin GroES (HSP10)
MAIDITIKKLNIPRSKEDIELDKTREKLGEKLQAELAAKHAADLAKKTHWIPLYSRCKIERAKETLSSLIDDSSAKALFVRGRILECGPEFGWRDGKQVHPELKPGALIIYQKAHELVYIDVHGTEHVFLKDNADAQSIVAVEADPSAKEVLDKIREDAERTETRMENMHAIGEVIRLNGKDYGCELKPIEEGDNYKLMSDGSAIVTPKGKKK